MSTQFGGKAANITGAAALTVTSVFSAGGGASQIVVSGSLPATFLTGVTVDITGVQGSPVVNGQWVATVVGANSFTVPATFSGAYTSGGSVQSLDLGTYATPDDGDNGNAASVDVALKTLGDRTAFLAAAVGATKNQNFFFFASKVAGDFSTTGSCAGGVAGGATGDWTGTIASVMPFAFEDGATINVVAGDLVLVTVVGNMLSAAPANSNRIVTTLWYANYAPPATATPTFTVANVPGAEIFITASGQGIAVPFTIFAPIVMLTTGLFDFKIRFSPHSATTTAGDVILDGGITASALVLRATSMPQ